MNQSEKIRVAVLYGGRSGEHEVSLRSAANVIQYLDRSKFEVVPVGIDKQGAWFLGDEAIKKELAEHATLRLSCELEQLLFNPDAIGKSIQPVKPAQLLPQANSAKQRIFDVVFPVIHGPLCEDGTVQGLLELADVPYVGCGVLSSAIGMDKDVSKRLVKAAGIATAPYQVVKRGQWDRASAEVLQSLSEMRFPVFVKPANAGSSLGITKVKQIDALAAAINNAFQYDAKVLVEQGIDAIELEVAVLESLENGAEPVVSVVGEVRSTHEFYSYDAKYVDENGAELSIPAAISPELQVKVRKAAADIFAALECEGMARVDLFLERGSNQIYFNEVNTIPGFTSISMYPKLMQATGVSYSELLTHLVLLATARHQQKSKISREYVGAP